MSFTEMQASTSQILIPPDVCPHCGAKKPGPPPDPTNRQAQVLKLLMVGYTNPQIAAELGVHLNTVKQAITRLLRTRGLTNRIQLSMLATEGESARSETAAQVWRSLTRRQKQVALAVRRGAYTKAIAAELGVSEQVVKNYAVAIYDKIGMSSRLELANWVREHASSIQAVEGTVQ